MPISLREARERQAVIDVYRTLRQSDRMGYLDLPDGAILATIRIVAGDGLDQDYYRTELANAQIREEATPRDGETAEDRATRIAGQDAARTAGVLARVLVAWDFSLEPDGPPIPIDEASLRKHVPSAVANDVLAAIQEYRNPSKKGSKR